MANRTVGWAIAHRWNNGKAAPSLYSGFCYTRAEMIAEHVHDKRTFDDPPYSRWPERHGKLSPRQLEAWNRHRKNGDRCIRVEIKWDMPK